MVDVHYERRQGTTADEMWVETCNGDVDKIVAVCCGTVRLTLVC